MSKYKARIRVRKGTPCLTSKELATELCNDHKNILEAIRDIIKVTGQRDDLFIATKYKSKNQNREYECFLITEKGFSLLNFKCNREKKLELLDRFESYKQKRSTTATEQSYEKDSPEWHLLQFLEEFHDVKEINKTLEQKVKELETNLELASINCDRLSHNSDEFKKLQDSLAEYEMLYETGYELYFKERIRHLIAKYNSSFDEAEEYTAFIELYSMFVDQSEYPVKPLNLVDSLDDIDDFNQLSSFYDFVEAILQ